MDGVFTLSPKIRREISNQQNLKYYVSAVVAKWACISRAQNKETWSNQRQRLWKETMEKVNSVHGAQKNELQ